MSPSSPNSDSRPSDGPSAHWPVFAALLLAFGLSALLGTSSLVEAAERQAYGPRRDRMLALATSFHQLARQAGLDRPAIGLEALRAGDLDAISHLVSRRVVAAEGRRADGVVPAVASGQPAYLPYAKRDRGVPMRAETTSEDRGLLAQDPLAMPFGSRNRSLEAASSPPGPAPRRRPSIEAPLRLHVAGDSFAEPLGLELQRLQALGAPIEVSMEGRIATALTRPDYFDWPARLSEALAEAAAVADMEVWETSEIAPPSTERGFRSEPAPVGPVEVLLLVFAGNEGQNMYVDGELLEAGSPEWAREYQQRAAGIMDSAGQAAVEVRWIGLPPMRDEPLASAALAINQVLREAVAERPWVELVETEAMFAGPEGGYALELPDERGEPYAARKRDGVHWTRPASDRVAALALAGMAEDWGFAEAGKAASAERADRRSLSE